jgi:hypothetical protein
MIVTSEHLNKSLSYTEYQELSQTRFAAGKTTGEAPEVNTEFYLHYTKMNLSRTTRVERKTELTDELKATLSSFTEPQQWVVLVESWCGDVPHSLPIINKISEYQPLVSLHILLRDENLDMMDAYLTNGGRSIPKLVAFNNALGKELFTWGPRPQALQEQIDVLKAEGVLYPEIAEMSQRWYNKDAGQEIQQELLNCLSA